VPSQFTTASSDALPYPNPHRYQEGFICLQPVFPSRSDPGGDILVFNVYFRDEDGRIHLHYHHRRTLLSLASECHPPTDRTLGNALGAD
jgi:hypothetical protein